MESQDQPPLAPNQVPTTPARADDDGQYVHLIGRARIGIDKNGMLTVTLLDKNRNPIEPALPLTFGTSIEFFNMHFVAEFQPKEMNTYGPTLKQATHSFIQFDELRADFIPCMNPGGPPCDLAVAQEPAK